jgi:hypothetical protein
MKGETMWIVKAKLQDNGGVIYDEAFVSDTFDAVANVKRIEDYVAPDRLIGVEIELATDITEGDR